MIGAGQGLQGMQIALQPTKPINEVGAYVDGDGNTVNFFQPGYSLGNPVPLWGYIMVSFPSLLAPL